MDKLKATFANYENYLAFVQEKLNKFFKENTLLSQESITESKTSVKDYVAKADKDLKVLGFRRLELGA